MDTGRIGFFLQVEDFDAAYLRMVSAGVEFVTPPRFEPYGRVALFRDIAGTRWDLAAHRVVQPQPVRRPGTSQARLLSSGRGPYAG
jgi:hypothetical protein